MTTNAERLALIEPDPSDNFGTAKRIIATLSYSDGTLSVMTESRSNNAVPMFVWNGHGDQIILPDSVDAVELNTLLDSPDTQILLDTIRDGYSSTSNGHQKDGKLSAAAWNAHRKLCSLFDALPTVNDTIGDWAGLIDAAGFYLYDGCEDTCARLGITAETSDSELYDMEATEYTDALEEGYVLDGAFHALKDMRDDLRDQDQECL